jgi:DNA polymerase
MNIVTLDFESYWSVTHSLTKMPPTEYVMHPDTEIISCAIKINDGQTNVYFGEANVRMALNDIDWTQAICVGHNMSGFDSMIVRWRFGIQPRMWACTAAMARPYHAKTCGVSLAALVKEYGLGEKDNTILLNTKGKHLCDFTQEELDAMAVYNAMDTDQCYALFKNFSKRIGAREMLQIHLLVEKLVNPQFVLDFGMLESTLEEVQEMKRRALLNVADMLGREWQDDSEEAMLEVLKGDIASAPKFAAMLEAIGCEVPLKPSPKKEGVMIPALAKNDEGMLALLESDDLTVATLAGARLGVKSTLLETRIQKFIRAGRACGGKLPVPIRYCGADTTGRDSGEQYNMLNLPRIGQIPRPSDALRMSLCAPKGYKVCVADLSGIELRVNHFLWKVPYSTRMWQEKADADLYRMAAVKLYGCAPDEVSKDQRQLEKVKALGLGFGAGGKTFRGVAKTMGNVVLTDEQAQHAVVEWRREHPEIQNGWYRCQDMLRAIKEGKEIAIDPWGLTHTCKEGIVLPSGRIIRYPDLRMEVNKNDGKQQWVYAHGRHKAYIYGGKMVENIVQALARDVMVEADARFYIETGITSCLRVYDEIVFIEKEQTAVEKLEYLQCIFRTPPVWWPDLVTWSEGDVADRYGEAK